MIAFLEKCREGAEIENPGAWVRVVARTCLLNMKREAKKAKEMEWMSVDSLLNMLDSPNYLDFTTPDSEVAIASLSLSHRLQKQQLLALYGKYVEDLSAPEIASTMGEPLTTVQARLRRGEVELRHVSASLSSVEHVELVVGLIGAGAYLIGYALYLVTGLVGFFSKIFGIGKDQTFEDLCAAAATARNDERRYYDAYRYYRSNAAKKTRYA